MAQKEISADLDYAVVAGLDLNGLGVVRALASAGVPVVALDTNFSKPTAATRYGLKLRVGAVSGDLFIDELLRLRESFGRSPVLFLTQEASVDTVSALRERISPAYRFTMPPDPVMRDLLDKIHFQRIAERHGFPVPRAVHLRNGGDPGALDQLRYPCVLKPAAKNPEYGRRFLKAYKVGSAVDALRLWEEVRTAADRVTVQEWIEGGDSDVYFCLQYRTAGGPAASFVGRKLCQSPPLVGGTASCIPAPEYAAELESLTNEFFAASGFSGMGSMEYKRDRRDGRFYMVEPTVGRTDMQEEIASLNGVNIPEAAYRCELGLSVPPAETVNPPRGWRDPIGSSIARGAGAKVARELTTGIRVQDAYFRADDPAPFFALKLRGVRNKISRIARLGRWPRPAVMAGRQ